MNAFARRSLAVVTSSLVLACSASQLGNPQVDVAEVWALASGAAPFMGNDGTLATPTYRVIPLGDLFNAQWP
jgi:hypothetical protein